MNNNNREFSYRLNDAIFTPRFGVAIIMEIQPDNKVLILKTLETGTKEVISIEDKGIKILKNIDTELAVDRALKSSGVLREELRKLAGLRVAKISRKKRLSDEAKVDKLMARAMAKAKRMSEEREVKE